MHRPGPESEALLMTDSPVAYEVEGNICHITFNRPNVLNAMNERMRARTSASSWNALRSTTNSSSRYCTAREVAPSPSVADLKEMSTNAGGDAYGEGVAFPVPVAESVRGIASVGACPKPVIAAIDGYCLAGGIRGRAAM